MGPHLSEVDLRLLRALLSEPAAHTLESLGRRLAAPPMQVAERLELLGRFGCLLDRHPQHGVRLRGTSLTCWTDYIEWRHPAGLGRRLLLYVRTGSTQDAARRLLAADPRARDGHVVVADEQSAGRGRAGRRWLARSGEALLLTAIVAAEGATVDRLVVATSCAVAEAIEALGDLEVRIRWPNDILLEGAKVAGILVERADEMALIGIGLNVHGAPAALPTEEGGSTRRATSLRTAGVDVDRLHVLDGLLTRLEATLGGWDDAALRAAWKARTPLLQQRVVVRNGGVDLTGRVVDLDPMQGLILQSDGGGLVALDSATTTLLSP